MNMARKRALWTEMLTDPRYHYFCKLGLIENHELTPVMSFLPGDENENYGMWQYFAAEIKIMDDIYCQYQDCLRAVK